mgnify:CR=1 FL=1
MTFRKQGVIDHQNAPRFLKLQVANIYIKGISTSNYQVGKICPWNKIRQLYMQLKLLKILLFHAHTQKKHIV